MKTRVVKVSEPKDRNSALNLAAYMTQQVEIHLKREENLRMNKSNAEEKLKRLQETIGQIENQIKSVDKTKSDWQSSLEILKTKFSLTESEILEVRSELLRKQITNLQRQAGIEVQGERLD